MSTCREDWEISLYSRHLCAQLKFLLLEKDKGTRDRECLSQEVRVDIAKIGLELNGHLADHQALIRTLSLRL